MGSHPINLAHRFVLEIAGLLAPSRSGEAVVQIPGTIRLLLELAFFVAATWSLYAAGATTIWWIYGIVVFVHYVVSYDRVLWLIQQ